MTKRLIACTFISSFLFYQTQAQSALGNDDATIGKPTTLIESIDFALKNNIQLRQNELSVKNNLNTLEQSRWLKYPTLNGFTGLNGNFGRNIDPFSNDVVTQGIATNNLGVGANVTLFNGYRIKNTVALNQLNLSASQLDFEAIKNTITLNVITAYLNVLSTEDQIAVTEKQLEVTKLQIERVQKLIDGGAAAESSIYELNAQLANDELNLVNSKNSHEAALLTLKQIMNMPANEAISVVRVNVPDPSVQAYPQTPDQIYEAAIAYLPEVKAADTRILVANKNIELAKAIAKPNITASTNWGSAYSSVAKNVEAGEVTYQQIPVSATVQGQVVPFVLNFPQQSYVTSNIPYFNQLNNNQNVNAGVSLSIPIFNGYAAKYRTEGAKIQKMQAELQSENTKLTIRQSIDQAYISMLNASKSYTATLAQVRALQLSFDAASARYGAGASNFTDYNLAKTRLDQAASNLIQAKYNYVFRVKILDFYQNKPLNF